MPRAYRSRRKHFYAPRRNQRPIHVENKYISAFQYVEPGSNKIETDISQSHINISSKTTIEDRANRSKRGRQPLTPMGNDDDRAPGTSAPKRHTGTTEGTKNQTELSLAEYAKSGQVPGGKVRTAGTQVIEKFSAVESHARNGNMTQAISVLDQASQLFSTLATTHEFVFSLAQNLPQTYEAHFRAVVLYFCSACLVKFGNSRVSRCVLGIGKVGTGAKQNFTKELSIPIMKILLEKAVGEDKAFSLNWISFACHGAGEFRWATNYANQGLTLMEEKFGKNGSPQHQVYCRLLLTRGEAHHHLGEYKNAATDLKRANITSHMAKDFGNQKSVVAGKIKQCRDANNAAIRRNRFPR